MAIKELAKSMPGDAPVETTHQLIGKFLTLRGKGMTPQQHMDAFWFYLKERGLSSHRAGIVDAIAQKVNVMIPGISEY